MKYSSKQRLLILIGERELIQLTDDEGVGVVNDALLEQIGGAADELIDSYIAAFLPLSGMPPRLRFIGDDITRHLLYQRRMIDTFEKSYLAGLGYLDNVRLGKDHLWPDGGGEPAAPADAYIEFSSATTVFGRQSE